MDRLLVVIGVALAGAGVAVALQGHIRSGIGLAISGVLAVITAVRASRR